jgi:hypothetical protein
MTPPKREERLNPMSRRKGRPPGRPPGAEWMVLGTTVTCLTCDWVGLEMDSPNAIDAVTLHHGLHHPNESLSYTIEEAQ